MDKITFNFRIDRATRNQFKKIAEANGTNATTLLTQWINDYLASNSKDSTDSKDKTDESAKTNVSVDNQTTNIEQIANAQTEELNKLWGAIYQQQKEIRKLNAKMQRRKTEIEGKVDHADLLNYFYGWSVPVNQEISLADRIKQLEQQQIHQRDRDHTAQDKATVQKEKTDEAKCDPNDSSSILVGKRAEGIKKLAQHLGLVDQAPLKEQIKERNQGDTFTMKNEKTSENETWKIIRKDQVYRFQRLDNQQ